MEIIRGNRIQQVPSQQHWSVVGSCGDIFTVALFKAGVRNMTCTCAASAICSHILAAMYSIDCEMPSKKKGNITMTHRKSRSRQRYRRSGTKKPSRMEKQSVSKSSKRKKDKDPVICTPEEPDSSEFENILPSIKTKPTKPKPKPRKLQDDLNSQLPPGKKNLKRKSRPRSLSIAGSVESSRSSLIRSVGIAV